MLARVHIRSRPAEFIHIQTEGQKNVEQDEHAQRGYDGYHRRVLLHPYGEQFVMDMVLVRQEGFFAVAYPMQVHPDHIAARNQQR